MSFDQHLKVAALSKTLSPELGWEDIRVDRASFLGNPFEITAKMDRDAVVEAFKQWLWEMIKLNQHNPNSKVSLQTWTQQGYTVAKRFKHPTASQVVNELKQLWQKLKAGKKIRLLCWCTPRLCHADIIVRCLIKVEHDARLQGLLT